MLLKRSFILILLFLALISGVSAGEPAIYPAPKKISNHGDSFIISQKIGVTIKKTEPGALRMLNDMLREKGAVINGSGAKSRIILRRVSKIEGGYGTDALSIKVASKRVNIDYTSPGSLKRAVQILESMIVSTGSNIVIEGINVTDWDGTGAIIGEGPIDAASRMVDITALENQIKHSSSARMHREVYIELIRGDKWRAESNAFRIINPDARIYPADGYYTHKQIKGLLDMAHRERIDLVPMVSFMAENAEFRKATGHSMFSVEGMRFVRALLEEYAEQWGCRKICVGKRSAAADERYLAFILDITARTGMQCVIID